MRETEAMYINNITSSSSTLTPSQQQAFDEYYDRQIPTVGMLMFFSLIGTPGNIIVLVVYIKSRMTTTQFLLSVMAMIDLFTALVGIPLIVFFKMSGLILMDITYCKIFGALNALCNTAGVFLVLGVSVIRYYYVCRPHSRHFVEAKVKMFCVFVGGMSLFYSVCFYHLYGEQSLADKKFPGSLCSIAYRNNESLFKKMFLVFVGIVFGFNLITIISTNWLILRRIWKQQKIMSQYNQSVMKKPLANYDTKPDTMVVYESRTFISQRSVSNTTINDCQTDEDSIFTSDTKHEKDCAEKGTEKSLKRSTSSERVQSRENGKASDKSDSTTRTQKVMENRKGSRINENGRKNTKMESTKGNNRTTLKLSIVCMMFVISYVPNLIIGIHLNKQGNIPQISQHDMYKFIFFPGINIIYLNCAVNPLIYKFVDLKI